MLSSLHFRVCLLYPTLNRLYFCEMSSWTSSTNFNDSGQEKITISHANGLHSIVVFCYGATLVSWKNKGIEKIFTSDNALLDGSKAIRGGIPLVFPQFGQPNKAMPQHGVARTAKWTYKSFSTKEESSATLIMELSDNEATFKLWPFKFTLLYSLTISFDGLECKLTVTNTDANDFQFHALLHTYFSLPTINTALVSGLQGFAYFDKVQNGALIENDESTIINFPHEVDRVYVNNAQSIPDVVITYSPESSSGMRIVKFAAISTALPQFAADRVNNTDSVNAVIPPLPPAPVPVDVVVWNPWVDKSIAMADLGPDRYQQFVCVEPGSVSNWVALSPGAAYTLTQKLLPID